jgi:uncharacterized membrane protein
MVLRHIRLLLKYERKKYIGLQVDLKRHILKTITYRFFATLTTIATALYLGASLEVSSLLGLGELLIKPIIYFFHERIWYKLIKLKK